MSADGPLRAERDRPKDSEADGSPRASTDTAELIDVALDERALVFGSLPPGARDLDVLVRPAAERSIAELLPSHGFVRRGQTFAAFGGCTAFAVDLVPAAGWGLSPAELDRLFDEALPLSGLRRLVRPSPEHVLLITARRFGWSGGTLEAKLATRIEAALSEAPDAWDRARASANAWGATRSLELLHRASGGGRVRRRDVLRALREGSRIGRSPGRALLRLLRRFAPRLGGTVIVAFSGLDGAGKSSQAAALRDTLERLGKPAVVVWQPLGSNPILDLIGKPAKKLLSKLRFGPLAAVAERSSSGAVMSNPGTSGGDPVRLVWATFVLVQNALAQRRAAVRHGFRRRTVIFDRHVLDSSVRLRFLYGRAGNARLQRWLLRTIAPTPHHAFLLEVSPETAAVRKGDDWTLEQFRRQAELYREELARTDVCRIDGEAAPERICAQVAGEVWAAGER